MTNLCQLETLRSVVCLAFLSIVVSIGCSPAEPQTSASKQSVAKRQTANKASPSLTKAKTTKPIEPKSDSPSETQTGSDTQPRGQAEPSTGDWPMFRGDAQGSGVATTTLPPNDQLEVLWEYKVKGRDGAFEASPIVVKNQSDGKQTVYVADLDGKVYSIDLETGD